MGDIVNLRQFRKLKQRQDKSAKAEVNRAKFCQSKLAKKLTEAEKARSDQTLDSARLERDDD